MADGLRQSEREKLGSRHALRHFQVQVSEDGMTASQIRDFADYTRYTNPLAYSNNLAYRLDYYKATEAARISAGKIGTSTAYSFRGHDGNEAMVELRALESTRVLLPAAAPRAPFIPVFPLYGDYNDDGVLDPRESLVYVPDSAKNADPDGAPVVVVFPGSTQAASTLWIVPMVGRGK